MRRSLLKVQFLLVFAALTGLMSVSPLSIFAQKTRKASMKRKIKNVKAKPSVKTSRSESIPWEGEAGVSRTMAEIMQAQSLLGKSAKIRKVEDEGERIQPDRRNLPQSENSPAIEKFPVDSTTKAVREVNEQTSFFAPQTVGLNFNGGTLFDTLSFPPDTMGEVGPSQYIMAVNGWIRSFNKTTGVADGVMNVDMDEFFNSVRGGISTSDPRIRYDRLSQRWIMVIINVANTDNRILIATSNTQNITPATVWTYYFFQNSTVAPAGDAGCLADYPTLGVDANALYIGVNNFCPNTFGGTTAFVVRKSSVMSGGPIVATAFRGLIPAPPAGAGLYTPQGVDNYNPASTDGYLIGVDNANFGLLKMRRISTPGGTPTISADIDITVPATAFPASVPHLGNTAGAAGNLDGNDDRLYNAYIRNGSIWTSHGIRVGATGVASSAGGRNGSRWYQIGNLTTTPTLTQAGTLFDSAATNPRSYLVPSISVSGQGHMAIGASSAGATERINAATVGRLSTDALGTLQSPAIITASTTAYNPAADTGGQSGRRFGDYSYTTVDPEDDMTMWTIQEWNHATNSYAMRVTKLIAPPPATPASALPATVNSGQSSVNVTITGTQIAGSGFFDPGAAFVKHIGATVSGVTVNSVTYTSPTQITLNLSTIAATAGAKDVTITNPDGQSVTAAGLITIAAAPAASVKIPSDFDGDGKTDLSVWRPSNVDGVPDFYVFNSMSNTVSGVAFGIVGDVIAPGDYDGDNKTDYGVYRNGTWFILRSSGGFQITQFGLAGDKPTPGDFDGDNKADISVFRPSTGVWYTIRSSDNAITVTQFGLAGDIPVFGRYDGDNRDDIAVFRSNTWYVLQSSNAGVAIVQFGTAGDIPTAGDYDGDGRYDYAVFRPSNGVWYNLQSSNGAFRALQWGTNGDVPAPGDYDGDSKFDSAVFRTSVWYVLRTTNGSFFASQFGLATDKPVPSAYIQ
jgi:hypothetical protein